MLVFSPDCDIVVFINRKDKILFLVNATMTSFVQFKRAKDPE